MSQPPTMRLDSAVTWRCRFSKGSWFLAVTENDQTRLGSGFGNSWAESLVTIVIRLVGAFYGDTNVLGLLRAKLG